MLRFSWILALFTLAIVVACGSDDSFAPSLIGTAREDTSKPSFTAYSSVVILDPEAPPVASGITIIPEEITIVPGQTVILNAVAFDDIREPVPGLDLIWSVANPIAGTINESGVFAAGRLEGIYPGAVEVEATQDIGTETITLSASAKISITENVNKRSLSTVGVYPSTVNVRAGQFIGLGALGWDSQGRFIPTLRFEWRMEDPQAGSIDELGFFTAGDTLGEYSNAIRVTATQPTPDGDTVRDNFISVVIGEDTDAGIVRNVEIIPKSVFLEPGDGISFSVHAFDGSSRPVEDVEFTWTVADPQAGVIDDLGALTAGSQLGHYSESVQVVATQTLPEGEVQVVDAAHVTIIEPPSPETLASTSIVPSSVTLRPGQKFIFTIVAFDETGEEVGAASYDWEVLDSRAGSIDEIGVFTASEEVGVYSDAVRVTLTGDGLPNGAAPISYASIAIVGELQRVLIQPSRVVLRPGQTVLLQTIGFDSNDLQVSPLLSRWSVENPEAGSINSAGFFTAGDQPGEYTNAIKAVVTER